MAVSNNTTTNPDNKKRFALIVASSQYTDPDLRKLIAPAQDAESLASILQNPNIGAFEVKTLLDEPSYKINEEIQAFFSDRGREDLLLLYFSCHGIKDEDGQALLCYFKYKP